MKQLLILGMIAALACSAFAAYPTLAGPSGLATLPTAAVTPAGQLVLAADWYNTDPDNIIPIRLVYGISESFEVGALYSLLSDANTWGVNAKYKLPVTLGPAGVALGAQYFNNSDIDEKVTQVYAVGTMSLAEATDTMPGFSGSLGVNWTSDDFLGSTESVFRFYAGLEAAFANKLDLAAEYQTKSDKVETDAIWSIVARYPFTEALTGQIGFTNAGLLNQPVFGASDHNIFAGVAYSFGTAASE
jgi:hypothetical protein